MESILVIGIDVAKEKLDVAIYNGQSFIIDCIPNTELGIEKLIRKVEGIANKDGYAHHNIHFVMEATGSYHSKLRHALIQENYNAYIVNPLTIRRYSEAQLTRTTTDKSSSKLIATYAYTVISSFLLGIPSDSYDKLMSYKVDTSDEENSPLKILVKTRDGYVKDRTRILNRIESLKQYPNGEADLAIESLKHMLEEIDKEIKNIERELSNMTHGKDAKEEYKETYEKLLTIPGIGSTTATAIIAYFGTFSHFLDGKHVDSCVGFTSAIDKSGKKDKDEGYAISKIGNPYLRQLLFMDALSASRYNHQCYLLYERMLKKGKHKKVALVAVADKLLRQVFAVAKYGRVYDPSYGIDEEKTEKIITKENRKERKEEIAVSLSTKTKDNTSKEQQNKKKQQRIQREFPTYPPFIQDEYPRITDY